MRNRDTEILTKLDQIIGILGQQGERIARIEGQLAAAPTSAEFHELRGRVEEISRRLPTPIAYQPPVRA